LWEQIIDTSPQTSFSTRGKMVINLASNFEFSISQHIDNFDPGWGR
jgi:hypothetical protein